MEVRSIAAVLNADMDEDVFTGARASENSVKTVNLSNYKVIAFATHGLLPGDLDGLRQPALALSSPRVTGHATNDGILRRGEILSLRLDADWVVLSRLQYGCGRRSRGGGVLGLGPRIFLCRHTGDTVVQLAGRDNQRRLLTTDLFRRQAENPTISRSRSVAPVDVGND